MISLASAAPRGIAAQLAHQAADGHAEFERPARAIAVPEGHLAGFARRRRHHHAVVRDLLDAPGGRAEHERLAHPRLEHHLLVELADARGALGRTGEEHAVEAAVGNRARVGDGHAPGALARGQRPANPVPGEARPQFRELVGRVAARQHVEDALEDAAARGWRTGRRSARWRAGRPRATGRSRPWPPPAARARRAGCAGSASLPRAPRAWLA